MVITLDKETSTYNKGHVHDPRNFVVSFSTKEYGQPPVFHYYTDPDFLSCLRSAISNATRLVGFNIKFDLAWAVRLGIQIPQALEIWDCSLAEFIFTGQEARFISLNECLEKYALPVKLDKVKEYWEKGISTEDIPRDIVEEYNDWDVVTTEMLYDIQMSLLSDKQKRLVLLEGHDMKTLIAAEHAGLLFDVDKAREETEALQEKLASIESQMVGYLPSSIPASARFNFDSGDQLSALLYGGTITFDWCTEQEAVYKSGDRKGETYIRRSWNATPVVFPARFKPLDGTEVKKTADNPNAVTRFYQVDEPTLKQLKTKDKKDKELIALILERAKLTKVKEMIASILDKMEERHWENNYIHAQFNQNNVITGRLSSSQPNMQNQPPEVDKLLVTRYA